jgi:hypothetical protein
MAIRRKALAQGLVSQVGAGAYRVVDTASGWPSHIAVRTNAGWQALAAHLGPIQSSKRRRESLERRFQNPGKNRPIVEPEGELPVLLGVKTSRKRWLLIGMDASHRIGARTRQSLFVRLAVLRSTVSTGWTEYLNAHQERIVVFDPFLLPIYVEALQSGNWPPQQEVQHVVCSEGLLDVDVSTRDIARSLQAIRRLSTGVSSKKPANPVQRSLL